MAISADRVIVEARWPVPDRLPAVRVGGNFSAAMSLDGRNRLRTDSPELVSQTKI